MQYSISPREPQAIVQLDGPMQKACVFPAPPCLNREYKPNGHREQLPQHMTASCESNVRDGVHSKLRRSYRREAISQENHVMLEGDYLIFCCDGNVMDNTESPQAEDNASVATSSWRYLKLLTPWRFRLSTLMVLVTLTAISVWYINRSYEYAIVDERQISDQTIPGLPQ